MSDVKLSEEVREQIESGYNLVMLMESLTQQGWHRIDLARFKNNKHAVDIQTWVADNCKGKWHSFGRHWIFENSEDAVMFRLKWV